METERIFFGNTKETTFSEDGQEADMRLSDSEKSVLLLDKRTLCSRNIFRPREE